MIEGELQVPPCTLTLTLKMDESSREIVFIVEKPASLGKVGEALQRRVFDQLVNLLWEKGNAR